MDPARRGEHRDAAHALRRQCGKGEGDRPAIARPDHREAVEPGRVCEREEGAGLILDGGKGSDGLGEEVEGEEPVARRESRA